MPATRPSAPTGRALEGAVRRVRRAWLVRYALRGAAAAAVAVGLGLALTAGLGKLGVVALTVPAVVGLAALALVLGAGVGALVGHRRRPDRGAVVAWIDARLGAGDAVSTVDALGVEAGARAPLAAAVAARALANAPPGALRPRVLDRRLLVAPLALAAGGAALALGPAPPETPPDPGAETVRADATPLLRPIERLAAETPSAPEARERLERLEDRAARLAEGLAGGMSRREALDAAARLRLDLEALDAETRRAAARREAGDRAAARALLDAASRDARARGDRDAEARLLDARARLDAADQADQAALARALLDGVPELRALRGAGGRRLERLARDAAGRLDRATVDAVTEAWARLSAAERARLAGVLGDAAGFAAPNDAPTGRGVDGPPDADAIEAALREALDQAGKLELALAAGGGGLPVPGAGGRGADGAAAAGDPGGAGGDPGVGGAGGDPGGGGDGTAGDGATPRLAGATDGVLARVRPERGDGAPGLTVLDRVDAREVGAGAVAAGGPVAVPTVGGGVGGGVERPGLPREYEAQVRAFFDGDR